MATNAGLDDLWLNDDLWLDRMDSGLEAGELWLGLRVLIPELKVGSKFYVM
jgi:hypothetical protein